MSMETPIKLTVTYRGAQHALSVLPDSTLSALQACLEELTSVPPSLQKLLYKGKKATSTSQDEDTTVIEVGLKDGMKIQLLGATMQELGGMKDAENAQRKREKILRERALKPQVKVRSTGPPPSQSYTNYRFHELVPLSHLPNPSSALALLTKLSEDPAIRRIMQKHQLSVGVLTELAPHEHPELLGLNVNAGQSIKLRLRTDRYDGFRTYREVRRVLCHELTHNVWGDHDENFKELNSKLNREVAEFELAEGNGTRRLNGEGDVYIPSPELEADTHTHVLGGNDVGSLVESAEERRQRILSATMNRLRKQEEELEQQCGTGRTVN
ncbi:WLM-domain-containing protein [Amanita rubescens]|nr:WLM-domain-containing protein [Amanita rubescens]